MVKAEITIEIKKDNHIHLSLDLLKREDWNESEFIIAKVMQNSLIEIIELLKDTGQLEQTYSELIKDDGSSVIKNNEGN